MTYTASKMHRPALGVEKMQVPRSGDIPPQKRASPPRKIQTQAKLANGDGHRQKKTWDPLVAIPNMADLLGAHEY